MSVFDADVYPIKPSHLATSNPGSPGRNFAGAFGDDAGFNRIAFVIVWMLDIEYQRFVPFTRAQLSRFCREHGCTDCKQLVRDLDRMMGVGILIPISGLLNVTHKFVSSCFAAALAPWALYGS